MVARAGQAGAQKNIYNINPYLLISVDISLVLVSLSDSGASYAQVPVGPRTFTSKSARTVKRRCIPPGGHKPGLV